MGILQDYITVIIPAYNGENHWIEDVLEGNMGNIKVLMLPDRKAKKV